MSRGYGRTQRRIIEVLQTSRNNGDLRAFTTPVLASHVYNEPTPSEAQLRSVRRALSSIGASEPALFRISPIGWPRWFWLNKDEIPEAKPADAPWTHSSIWFYRLHERAKGQGEP